MPRQSLIITCRCREVEIALQGDPIASTACYCNDCQAGGRMIEALPDAPPIRTADGGTPYLLYRNDRIRTVKGADLLDPIKLKPDTATNRIVATCCNTGLYVGFDRGPHWVSVYALRAGEDAPSVEQRMQLKHAPDRSLIPNDDVPASEGYPLSMIGKLLAARVGMLFGP